MSELFDRIRQSKVYDLAQPYFVGMPHYPTHPPFLFGLTKKHGDLVAEGGVSSAADAIALGSHVGTHIDALCHFSCGGKLYGGMEAAVVQSDAGGIREHSVDTIAPILRRGVLLDVAAQVKTDALPTDFSITAEPGATLPSLVSSPRWVATVTSGGRINVPANSSVVRIGCGLCMCVAVDAGKYRVVGGVRMAVPASSPDFGMGAGVDRELAMGESGAAPGGGGVTIRAGGGESGSRVVGVVGGGVLGLMARDRRSG